MLKLRKAEIWSGSVLLLSPISEALAANWPGTYRECVVTGSLVTWKQIKLESEIHREKDFQILSILHESYTVAHLKVVFMVIMVMYGRCCHLP